MQPQIALLENTWIEYFLCVLSLQKKNWTVLKNNGIIENMKYFIMPKKAGKERSYKKQGCSLNREMHSTTLWKLCVLSLTLSSCSWRLLLYLLFNLSTIYWRLLSFPAGSIFKKDAWYQPCNICCLFCLSSAWIGDPFFHIFAVLMLCTEKVSSMKQGLSGLLSKLHCFTLLSMDTTHFQDF